jgi:ATP-dependent Clp protease ATP-binding subunit ClpA
VGVEASVGFASDNKSSEESRTEKALSQFLRPEFINRVDEIITFRSLEVEDFVRIASIMLSDLRETLSEKGITFSFTEAAAKYLAKRAFSRKFGARNLRRLITKEVEDKIAEEIISSYGSGISSVAIDSGENGLDIRCLKN